MPNKAQPMPDRIVRMLEIVGRPMAECELFSNCRRDSVGVREFRETLEAMEAEGTLASEERSDPLAIGRPRITRKYTYYRINGERGHE